ncbi:radical SAM protein [Desulfohalobiaceae bacterium Ax17]|uniref:elongator complex protein 3 n=1 Tax=Desulfovulcanus ferrireducens TaxID=2831190 RepID=UPI00207BC980|nr:radical SAM protein [Desulfovulcanus ferrireducens]MBT8762647.1 radical SAM protein [Desulfovulcanus ferrireducens]
MKIISLKFYHPEPQKKKMAVWPVFLPFAGCSKTRCVYCAQNLQTGELERLDFKSIGEKIENELNDRFVQKKEAIGLGFFGGTFTGLSKEKMIYFLSLTKKLKDKGIISHIRCSTRPDMISPDILSLLGDHGVDLVELGVQSFDNQVLELSGRGYCRADIVAACEMISRAGLSLGIQLLPGLPGHALKSWFEDVRFSIEMQPEVVRIYPCLVLKSTLLARWWAKGQYQPWSLPETVSAIALSLPFFWRAKVQVIRLGLTPEKSLMKNILAGPWHPALGNMCRSIALRHLLLCELAKIGSKLKRIYVPKKYLSEFWGYKGINKKVWAKLGIQKSQVEPWEKDYFQIFGVKRG